MRIDGKQIADQILESLAAEIKKLAQPPTLAIIQIGDDPASAAYIRQKQKAAERIGIQIVISHTLSDVSIFNNELSIHGVIIQRPVPGNDPIPAMIRAKDVDGFLPNSPFTVPVALAVEKLLESTKIDFTKKNIVVIGRGETAGKPIHEYFTTSTVIHSQTLNPEEILKNADIIISCVGKKRVIIKDSIKPGVILISVGIWRDTMGKLHGDYEESEILDIASFYTPTPGGVGPVNVACLMQNVVKAYHYRS